MGITAKIPALRYHPWYSVWIAAWAAFCNPGMFAGLNGLGGAGQQTVTLANTVNAVTFGTLFVGGLFVGTLCNRIGIRWSLVLGCLGYVPYGAAMYTNARFQNRWFPILGAVLCGVSGTFLWAATGAIAIVYPPVHQRGRAIATRFGAQNMGGFIGGLISVGLNAKNNRRGRVSDSAYFVFISLMCLGLPAALTLPANPTQIVRRDGSRVAGHKFLSWREEFKRLGIMLRRSEFLLLAPFLVHINWNTAYMWGWNAVYHSVRARAVLSTCFYFIGPAIFGPIFGFLLDYPKWRRVNRAKFGVSLFCGGTMLVWVFGLIVQYQYNNRDPGTVIDLTDPVFAKSIILFILYGIYENATIVIVYWLVSSLALKPGEVASLIGLVISIGCLGSTAAFVIGATKVTLTLQLWANVVTFTAGVPGLMYLAWRKIREDSDLHQPTNTENTESTETEVAVDSNRLTEKNPASSTVLSGTQTDR